METLQDQKEKVVYIKRKQTFIEEANADPEVQEYFNMSYRAIGSYYKVTGKVYGSGLTRREEELLLPEIVGIYPQEDRREYHRAVKEFYRNINTKIPPEGLRLNIALEDDSRPLSEDNMPVSVRDYVIYRHAIQHPETAMSLEEAERYQHKRFYIEDTDSVISNLAELSRKEDDALIKYYEIADDFERVKQVLTVFGIDTTGKTFKEMKLLAKKLATIDNSDTAPANKERMTRFIQVVDDRYLETKYHIENMISLGILDRVGSKILIKESGELIGNSMKEAALWFNDKANLPTANMLKAKYRELKRPDVLPKDVKVESDKKEEGDEG